MLLTDQDRATILSALALYPDTIKRLLDLTESQDPKMVNDIRDEVARISKKIRSFG